MFNPMRILSIIFLVFFVVGFTVSANAAQTCGDAQDSFAEVMIGSSGINFMPKVSYAELTISVARADGTVFQQKFEAGSMPYLDLANLCGGNPVDGIYSYELRATPPMSRKIRRSNENAGLDREIPLHQRSLVQTGSVSIQNGSIVMPSGAPEELSRTNDILQYDDVIITGSLCVGFDCINGESFGYCTLKLKENNLQLCFEDTSLSPFPTNDWKIQINDTTSGGASYFTLWDTDGGRRPFTIEAGAPAHSLYVEDYGRVGLGTSIPYVELHIVDGDSPTIRLDQDGSSGWAAQRWDLCGNETNFFVRDVTNGSKLCMRIQPNTPSNTLCMKSTGYVGIGTWSPLTPMELETTGEHAVFIAERTDGATAQIAARADKSMIGSRSDHNLNLCVNNLPKMTIATNGYIGINDETPSYPIEVATANNARLEVSGNWVNPSSRELKENIEALTTDEAIKTLEGLNPVKYNYKVDKVEKYVGFIAEDVPELVAVKDRKGLVTMDVVAVLTKVLQDQQKTIAELKKKIAELEKK